MQNTNYNSHLSGQCNALHIADLRIEHPDEAGAQIIRGARKKNKQTVLFTTKSLDASLELLSRAPSLWK